MDIANESDDKLDEFSRLELEMAELDKTDDAKAENSSVCTNEPLDKKNDITSVIKSNENVDANFKQENKCITDESTSIQCQNGKNIESSKNTLSSENGMNSNGDHLDHEDLIAVLKGDAIENQKASVTNDEPKKLDDVKETPSVTGNDGDLLIEGVTIEGEGEYQIMEVVDDIEDETESILPSTSKVLNNTAAVLQQNQKNSPTQKLTPEEERAMAMEQIAGLNARGPRRRKQDIKPLQFEASELVSTLGADWSEDDETNLDRELPTSSKQAAAIKQAKAGKKENAAKLQSSVEEITSTGGDVKSDGGAGPAKKRRGSSGPKITSVVVLKPIGEDVSDIVSSNTPDVTTSTPETASIGFKRTRTIKRRIIWDPDAPETTFSYANLVRNNMKDRQESSPATVTSKVRSVTPREIIPGEKKGVKRSATPSQSAASKSTNNESGQKTENADMPSTSKQTRRAQITSPETMNLVGQVAKKKKISEVDRLMGDEGAANMLHSLESGRNKSGDDSDKPHKPLMRNRGNALEKVNKKDQITVSAVSASTTKSKRAPKPKPSTTWDYVYKKKQQLNDDSMIIRRRSNSSTYSSNTSQHRLSLDGTSGLPTKSNARSSEASSDDGNDSTPEIPRKLPSKNESKNVSNITNGESISSTLNKTTNASASGNKFFEFAKPKDAKSNQKTPNRRTKTNAITSDNELANDIKKTVSKRGPGRPTIQDRLQSSEETNAQNTITSNSSSAVTASDLVCVRKIGKVGHILFHMDIAEVKCTFTPQIMNKIVSALNNLAEDGNCHVVVVTTSSPHFCQGVDVTNLVVGTLDQRRLAANVLAAATKNFLRTLATFPKPIVAAIHGTIIGLGVIQLPLFDVVVASDKTSFETPYAKIGQIPEGFCIWESLSNVRETAKTKLLWLAEKMYSSEASTSGLIDKVTTVEKVNDEAINIAKNLSAMSTETYRHMKDFVVQKRSEAIKLMLDNEFDTITNQWTSSECFNKFKKSLEVGHF